MIIRTTRRCPKNTWSLLYGLSCSVPLLLASTAIAEQTEASQITQMEVITVTANKVEEDIQKVPQSITVLDEAVLEEKNITDISGITEEIPNMYMSKTNRGNALTFRGINSSIFTNTNPVVIYINDVPIVNRYGYDASLVDVERVEILRGPQGTLYGKDAIGGVINIISKQPENEWHGMVGAEYGSYNFMQGTFNVNGALIKDTLFVGLNGKYQQDDGWIENTYPGMDSNANESDNQQLSGYLLYKPNSRLTARLNLSMDNSSDSWFNGYALPGASSLSDFNRDDAEEVSFDTPAVVNTDNFSQSLHLSYDFDMMTLTSTTTHRRHEMEGEYDADNSDSPSYSGLQSFLYGDSDTYTQELRLSSNNETGIRWVGGIYCDTESYHYGPFSLQFPSYDANMNFNGNYEMDGVSDTDADTYAAFAQAMIPLGERFELTLGGRYQHIDKQIDYDLYYLPVGITGPAMFSYDGDKSWDVFLPKAALRYSLNDDWDAYISYTQGYMPGGFNYWASSGTADENSFEPQQSMNYEVGIKGTLDRLRVSAALFYMEIEDIHVYRMYGNGIFYCDNANSAHSQGLEIDASYQFSDTVELTAAFGLIEAKYDDYDAGNGINYDGQDIQYTPAYTVNAGISWRIPSGYYARAGIRAVGDMAFFNNSNDTFEDQDGYMLVDAKVGYQTGAWDFYVYGKNLTDEEYIQDLIANTRWARVDFGDPLTVGVGIRYKF